MAEPGGRCSEEKWLRTESWDVWWEGIGSPGSREGAS